MALANSDMMLGLSSYDAAACIFSVRDSHLPCKATVVWGDHSFYRNVATCSEAEHIFLNLILDPNSHKVVRHRISKDVTIPVLNS